MNVGQAAIAAGHGALVWDIYAHAGATAVWSVLVYNRAMKADYFILFRPDPSIGPGGLLNYAEQQGCDVRYMIPLPEPQPETVVVETVN